MVGVVIPMLDVAPWLDAMLGSLRAQTYADWSAVAVDDGSSDDTVAIAEAHAAADPRITVVTNPHRGPGARLARIHGRSLLPAGIDYLYFPDADDLLEPTLLERLVGRLEARPGAVAAFCGYSRIGDGGEAFEGSPTPRLALSSRWVRALADGDEDTPFASLYAGAPAWEGLTMFRRTAYDEAGGFGESPAWGSHVTLDLLLRLSFTGSVVYVPGAFYRWRRRPGQASGNRGGLDENERALRRLWQARGADDPAIGRRVAEGEFLIRHRLTPQLRLRNAGQLARRGRLVAAAPRVALAALSYRWRLPR
jgi:glycosyltransferase involved in cell wall biosynthesis